MDEPPDPAAGRDLQPKNGGSVPASWLNEFADSPEAQLVADYELLTEVMFESFNGPAWDKMAERLVAYGLVVMKSWLRRGVIFTRCAEKGWGIRHAMHNGIDDPDDR